MVRSALLEACEAISDVIPGMNAIAFTREVRALASLEGWCSASCLRPSFEARKKERAPQNDVGDSFTSSEDDGAVAEGEVFTPKIRGCSRRLELDDC